MTCARIIEPQEPETISFGHCRYNGRDYYGTGYGSNGDAASRSELDYLRDWKRWAEQELRGLNAFMRSFNEALNSGDGSYRP